MLPCNWASFESRASLSQTYICILGGLITAAVKRLFRLMNMVMKYVKKKKINRKKSSLKMTKYIAGVNILNRTMEIKH